MRSDRMFKEAKKLAKNSMCNYRVGAVTARSKILGRGWNKSKTHSSMKKHNESYDRQIHAELAAVLATGTDIVRGADLFVCRILKDNSFALARPCETCYNLARSYGVRRIYYTISDTEYGVIHD